MTLSSLRKCLVIFLSLLTCIGLCSCNQTAEDHAKEAADASSLSYPGALYSANNGLITFFYQSGTDIVEIDVEEPNQVSVYCPEAYSAEIAYTGQRQKMSKAEKTILATLSDFSVQKTQKAEICGYDAKYIPFSGDKIRQGGVYFFNTARGFVQIYFLEVDDISEAQHTHFNELLSTLRIHD